MKKEVNFLLPLTESLQLSYTLVRMLSKLDLHFLIFPFLKTPYVMFIQKATTAASSKSAVLLIPGSKHSTFKVSPLLNYLLLSASD